jgi:hypothetical protein
MLAPLGEACECVEHGRFHFDVEVRQRFVGLIVRYRGWLVPRRPIARGAVVGQEKSGWP